MTLQKVIERDYKIPAPQTAEEVIGYYARRIDKDKKARNHIRQLQALGFAVTLTPAA